MSAVSQRRIGECDWCGNVDHDLVGGECPLCRMARHPVHVARRHLEDVPSAGGIEVEEHDFDQVEHVVLESRADDGCPWCDAALHMPMCDCSIPEHAAPDPTPDVAAAPPPSSTDGDRARRSPVRGLSGLLPLGACSSTGSAARRAD